MRALMIGREQAVADRMVSLVQAEGLDAAGTTSNQEAVSQLESDLEHGRDVRTLDAIGELGQVRAESKRR